MARFTHPSITSSASTDQNTWQIEGGTTGAGAVQPTFDGDPMFTGHYMLIGKLCNFAINVEFDNITSFGTGQYYVKLPFPTNHNILLSDGCIHDASTENQYSILGHAVENSDTLTLLSVASNGRHVNFTNSVPFALNQADNFHIAGTYEIV